MATNDMLNTANVPFVVTHGGTGLASTTANQLLYSSGTSVIAGLATGNNSTLITSAGGVPSISTTLPTLVQQNSTVMGTNSALSVSASAPANSVALSASGYQTLASQPAFNVTFSAPVTNVTGDGTVYTALFNSAITNISSSYNTGTGIFTAPVAGNYLFDCTLNYTGLAAGNLLIEAFFVQNATSNSFWTSSGVIQSAAGTFIVTGTTILTLALNDTVKITTDVTTLTKVVGLSTQSFFSGILLG